jgi:hypothetical protein
MQTTENKGIATTEADCQYQPHRLYNLWDMISFLAGELIGLLDGLDRRIESCDDALSRFGAGSELTKEEKDLIRELMDRVENVCQKLALDKSEERRRGIWLRTVDLAESPGCQNGVIASELKELKHALEFEFAEKQFAFIPNDKVRFFEQLDLFGETVSAAFPSAQPEIKDAGNCLAADLHTAAVFHLMRAVEVGLRAFAKKLRVTKVKTTIPIELGTWEEIIKALETKVNGSFPRTKRGQADADFYKELFIGSSRSRVGEFGGRRAVPGPI